MGIVYRDQKNDVLKSLPYFKKSIETSIEFRPNHLRELASTYMAIGEYEKAKEYLQESLRLQPNNGRSS